MTDSSHRFLVGLGVFLGAAVALGQLPVLVPIFDQVSEVALSLTAAGANRFVGVVRNWGAPDLFSDSLAVGLPVAVPGLAAAAAVVTAEAGVHARRVLSSLAVVLAVAAFFYLPFLQAVTVMVACLLFGAAAWFGGLAAAIVVAASAGMLAVRHLTLLYHGSYPELAERAAELDRILGDGSGSPAWTYVLMGIAGLPFLWAFVRVTGFRIAPDPPPPYPQHDPYRPPRDSDAYGPDPNRDPYPR